MTPYYCLFVFLLSSCISLELSGQTPVRKEIQRLESWITDSEVFQEGFTGFCLFDPEAKRFLIDAGGTHYYTPASNTKIITAFAALTLLGEGMPVINYQSKADTLWLWGTGYPLLLHPDFIGYDTLGQWLAERPEQVWMLADGHYRDERFGEGWSWDDYPYGYQLEKAALPIYGNRVQFSKQGRLARLELYPVYFQDLLVYEKEPIIGRLEDRNIFTFGAEAVEATELDRYLPFRYSGRLAAELLADTFKRVVHHVPIDLPDTYECLRAPVSDTLYQQLLQDSDNFLAEQLLLQSSAERYGWLETASIIAYVNDTILAKLPQPLDWVDGSGLSRYNQMSPQGIVLVLHQLLQAYPEEKILSFFPAGGESGTIKEWYAARKNKPPYIFAKTGTLRHTHCLSGYLRAKSGKLYIFSFMHNNFQGKLSLLKKEMQKFLEEARETL